MISQMRTATLGLLFIGEIMKQCGFACRCLKMLQLYLCLLPPRAGCLTSSYMQASPLPQQLPLLQLLAAAATCWTGAGAATTTTMATEATAAGAAGMAATVAVTTTVSPLLQQARLPVVLLIVSRHVIVPCSDTHSVLTPHVECICYCTCHIERYLPAMYLAVK